MTLWNDSQKWPNCNFKMAKLQFQNCNFACKFNFIIIAIIIIAILPYFNVIQNGILKICIP